MGMIRDEQPCVAGGFSLGKEFRKTLQEIFPVFFVYEDLPTLYTPDPDVMQNTRRV